MSAHGGLAAGHGIRLLAVMIGAGFYGLTDIDDENTPKLL